VRLPAMTGHVYEQVVSSGGATRFTR